jgi:hypothetical protein
MMSPIDFFGTIFLRIAPAKAAEEKICSRWASPAAVRAEPATNRDTSGQQHRQTSIAFFRVERNGNGSVKLQRMRARFGLHNGSGAVFAGQNDLAMFEDIDAIHSRINGHRLAALSMESGVFVQTDELH